MVQAICLRLTILISLIFTFVSIIASEEILRILAPDPKLVALGKEYLQILALSFLIFGVKQVFGIALRSIGQAKPTMYASLVAFAVNASLNYILIFGKLGFPAMGVKGAAIATCIARAVELLWILRYVLFKDTFLRMKVVEIFRFDRAMSHQFMRISTPVITTETLWALSQLLYTMAYVRISTDAAAAIQLSGTVQSLMFVFIMSLSAASAVIVGQAIGAEEDADTVIHPMAARILRITVLFGLLCAAIEILAPGVLMVAYSNLTPELWEMTANLLRVRGIFILVRFLNSVLILGVFRAGADVRVPMLVEMITTWGFAVPMAFIAGLLLNLGIYWTLAFVTFEEVIKLAILIPRYKRQKWINLV